MSNRAFSSELERTLGELTRLMQAGLVQNMSSLLSARAADNGMQVVIHNNAGVDVRASATSDALGQKFLEITIDQMVSDALLRGTRTSGVLRGVFGLVPDLLGR